MSKPPKWMLPIDARNPGKTLEQHLGRTPYLRDYGSIVHSSVFRRMSRKTQVYSSPNNDHIRTRLTHSIEVEQISRHLCRFFISKIEERKILGYRSFLEEFQDLTAAAALAHDLGHAPFGHVGQKILNRLASTSAPERGRCEFDDNKQVFRIFLCPELAPDINVTAQLALSTVKKVRKAFYEDQRKEFDDLSSLLGLTGLRHPASYLMEAADDIAYMASDLQDALSLRIDQTDEFKGLISNAMALPRLNSKFNSEGSLDSIFNDSKLSVSKRATYFLRALIFHAMRSLEESLEGVANLNELPVAMHDYIVRNCHKEEYSKSGELNFLFCKTSHVGAEAVAGIKDRIYGWILGQKYLGQQDIVAQHVLSDIWECLKEIEGTADLKKSPVRLLPKEYSTRIESCSRNEPDKIRRVLVDFISGMTDQYAIDFWNQIRSPDRLRF